MDYNSSKNGARTNGDQSETAPEFRVSFESLDFPEQWKICEQEVARERLARKGDLYFIRAGDAVKIGHTINIVNRLAKMQADNHETLDCLLILKGRGSEEAEWHKRFRHRHLRGEWFCWAADIEATIVEAREANRSRTID